MIKMKWEDILKEDYPKILDDLEGVGVEPHTGFGTVVSFSKVMKEELSKFEREGYMAEKSKYDISTLTQEMLTFMEERIELWKRYTEFVKKEFGDN